MNAYLGGSIVTFADFSSPTSGPHSTQPNASAEWLDYCRKRELAERAAAKNAQSIEARRVHQELAQAYMQRRETGR